MHPTPACIFAKVVRLFSRRLLRVYSVLSTSLGRAEERVAKLVDSPDQPESEASYKLAEGGWGDV